MKIISVTLLILAFTLLSCKQSRKDKIIHYLTDGSKKYWTCVQVYPIKWYEGRSYDINGTYTDYGINDVGKREKWSDSWSPTWKLINDSIIADGQGINLWIVYIDDDILVLNNLNHRDQVVYIRSKDQKAIPIPDTHDHSRDL